MDVIVTLVLICFLRKHHLFTIGTKFIIYIDWACDTKNVLYLPYCKKCNKQGVWSSIEWKPRLRNYKSNIKSKYPTCSIVNQLIDEYNDHHVLF